MTRQQFIETITNWWELREFCTDQDCDTCDNIYDEEGMDYELNNAIDEYARDYPWYDLRDLLNDIPSGYDAYRQNSAFDWDGLDSGNDFDDYKAAVLDWMDEGGFWEDEEEGDEEAEDEEAEEPEPLTEEEDEEEAPPEEDFSVKDFFGMCSASFVAIQH